MNRPFGAVDVSANLKGAVPKTATQKILLALSEKGEVTQKVYGKYFIGRVTAELVSTVCAENDAHDMPICVRLDICVMFFPIGPSIMLTDLRLTTGDLF